MDRRIRYLSLVLLACFGLLFLQLNNFQVLKASSLQKTSAELNSANSFEEARGSIVSSDGVVLAYSTPTNDQYKMLRHYPKGPLFADITGYFDTTQSAAPLGLEAAYNRYLLVHQSVANNLSQILTERSGTDSVETTVSDRLQQVAQNALDGKIGAVVAIDVHTGAVLAMYSNPTYNPNLLASHDVAKALAAYERDASGGSASPLINGATLQTYPPGSTFKVITTSAIYDHKPSLAQMVWPVLSFTSLPETNETLQNFDREACGGDLAEVLAVSCDTAYARIGLSLKAPALAAEANAFGFNKIPPIDLPSGEVSPACFPPVEPASSSVASCPGSSIGPQNEPFIAYSAIGQGNVTETALQDALVASAIGDNGTIMAPHLMANVVDDQGRVVVSYKDHRWLQATSAKTASLVRNLMLGVASFGTAAGVFPASLHVAAKTGTAETGLAKCSADWMIATAPAGALDTPQVAVAAVLPAQARLTCSETGAEAAGPVVATVLEAALQKASN